MLPARHPILPTIPNTAQLPTLPHHTKRKMFSGFLPVLGRIFLLLVLPLPRYLSIRHLYSDSDAKCPKGFLLLYMITQGLLKASIRHLKLTTQISTVILIYNNSIFSVVWRPILSLHTSPFLTFYVAGGAQMPVIPKHPGD